MGGCLGLGAAFLDLGCCMHLEGCLGLGCMLAHGLLPWPWLLHAHGGLPRPWPLHALAFAAACPWGAALALAAACPCLGCLPMRAALALAAARLGQAVGIPGACPRARHAASPRIVPQNWLVPFSIFVSLNSFHDFRGGFQQAVQRSEHF